MIGIYIIATIGILFFTFVCATFEVCNRPLYGDSNDSWWGAIIRWAIVWTIVALLIINYIGFY